MQLGVYTHPRFIGFPRMDLLFVRIGFILAVAVVSYLLEPFGLHKYLAGVAGIAVGAIAVALEHRLRMMSLKRLIGAVVGAIFGILGAYLVSLVIHNTVPEGPTHRFLELIV